MKKKSKDSKLNVVLTSLLVVFVCLLSFSIGVISGKGWSDRDYKVRHIEQDSHLKMAQEDNAPIGDEITDKEVELLTQKALREAQAEAPVMEDDSSDMDTSSMETETKTEESAATQNTEQPERDASMSAKPLAAQDKRTVSSVRPRPSTPAPKSIEYTVQVAAYKTKGEAEGHAQKLIDKGFPAFPVKAIINGQDWYRVSIGSFKNRKQAMKYEKALKKQAMVKSTFVQKITRIQ